MPTPSGAETRAERRARQAREGLVLAAENKRAFAASLARVRAVRRRRAWIALGAGCALALLVAFVGARIAARADDAFVEVWIGFGGRFSHVTSDGYVAVDHAAVYALEVMAVPVVLAAVTLLVLHLPRVRDRWWVAAPMWLGVALAPGLAVSVLLGYTASVLGQGDDDLLPALAQLAPEGLPMLAFFTVLPALAWRDKRRRGRPRRARTR